MKYYSLPIDLNVIDSINKEEAVIDMSDLKFPCDESKQVRSSFIFIRNTDLDMNFDFEKCSYEMKEEYLLFYFKGNINVNIPVLSTTWLEILFHEYTGGITLQSILNNEEIEKFINRNGNYVNEIHRFIVSIPISAINFYLGYNMVESDISMDEFPQSDFDELNLDNFIHLVDYSDFMLLITPRPGIEPTFYTKYFNRGENDPYKQILISKLPFLNMINMMINPKESVNDTFVNKTDELLANNKFENEEYEHE